MSTSRKQFAAISILLAMVFAQSTSLADSSSSDEDWGQMKDARLDAAKNALKRHSKEFEQLKLPEEWLREKAKPVDPQNSVLTPVIQITLKDAGTDDELKHNIDLQVLFFRAEQLLNSGKTLGDVQSRHPD